MLRIKDPLDQLFEKHTHTHTSDTRQTNASDNASNISITMSALFLLYWYDFQNPAGFPFTICCRPTRALYEWFSEHNHRVPGSLNETLAHISRTCGELETMRTAAYLRKPGVISHSKYSRGWMDNCARLHGYFLKCRESTRTHVHKSRTAVIMAKNPPAQSTCTNHPLEREWCNTMRAFRLINYSDGCNLIECKHSRTLAQMWVEVIPSAWCVARPHVRPSDRDTYSPRPNQHISRMNVSIEVFQCIKAQQPSCL